MVTGLYTSIITFSSVQFSPSVMSDSLPPHESQHARPPCPSPTPRVHSDSHPSSQWCHPAISSSVIPFSSCPQALPASESFPMSQLFTWGGQSTGVSASASFPPKKSQGWSPSKWTGWISLQSKGLSRVFSNTTVQININKENSWFSNVWLFTTLWTTACQAPLSMGFSKQEYWNGLPCPASARINLVPSSEDIPIEDHCYLSLPLKKLFLCFYFNICHLVHCNTSIKYYSPGASFTNNL